VTAVTALGVTVNQNAIRRDLMPILMLALVALVTFGLIGLILVVATTLEQRKAGPKAPSPGKTA
jgi:hypothetical protein